MDTTTQKNSDLKQSTDLESHFEEFRRNTVGYNSIFEGPYGKKQILYADWIASGRMYRSIEDRMSGEIAEHVANTHTETSYTGMLMTHAYHEARERIKKHINAGPDDVMIPTGTGMTGAVLKLQRMLGLKVPEQYADAVRKKPADRPVVFISHMEHHSNHTSWLETLADVEVIAPTEEGKVDLDDFERLLHQYRARPLKIASVTSCSNVTGAFTPYREIAQRIHREGGLCFADFAASGPYVKIDMHPPEEGAHLDAIFFSPHKFLGGPGSPGILAFNKNLYHNKIPDQPGGGTVTYTNPWGIHQYIEDIEVREDGGTPGFLQTIRAAMALELKNKMNVAKMQQREEQLVHYFFNRMTQMPGVHILAGNIRERIGAISFYLDGAHYNLVSRLLNDRYGIQVRGGCSCAGTYGHYLLSVDPSLSESIRQKITNGDLSAKPGWVRLSVHPMMTDKEASYIADAIEEIAHNHRKFAEDYQYVSRENEFYHRNFKNSDKNRVHQWFEI